MAVAGVIPELRIVPDSPFEMRVERSRTRAGKKTQLIIDNSDNFFCILGESLYKNYYLRYQSAKHAATKTSGTPVNGPFDPK